MAFVRLSNLPAPSAERICNIPSLAGGLNIHDDPVRLAEDQSPELVNLWWKDGLLHSRPAQTVFAALSGGGEGDCACYPQLYHGHYIVHRGHQMWAVSADGQTADEISTERLTYTDEDGETIRGLPEICGSFVCHNGTLYYKTRGIYAVIAVGDDGFTAHPVDAFCPTYLINADPGTPGAGDLYQPLNRLKHSFYVTYSPAEDETTDFYAPFYDCSVIDVEILDSSGTWVSIDYGGFNYVNRQTRGVRIKATDKENITAGQNNVRILFSRRNFDDFQTHYDQLMSCNLAAVYGGGAGLCVVLAGCSDQPNAWFWSANTDISMDPTYFPTEHYNLAGDFSDPITALGQQQNKLVIFQKSRIGGAQFGTVDIDGRTFITMDYAAIHPTIGCDLPGSVQLIENNLVFANRDRGIFLLRDTTAAGENTIAHLSNNIERSPDQAGLLKDLKENCTAVSMDDGERYWLMLGEHAWLWDYRLGGSVGNPRSLSWFYFENLRPAACPFEANGMVGRDGVLYRFDENEVNFESVLALPVRHFGTYEMRKNISKIIFALEDGEEGEIDVEYITDHGIRTDPAPLRCRGSRFAEIFVRRPRCLGVRHFLCVLRTTDKMAFASAQVHYVLRGKER